MYSSDVGNTTLPFYTEDTHMPCVQLGSVRAPIFQRKIPGWLPSVFRYFLSQFSVKLRVNSLDVARESHQSGIRHSSKKVASSNIEYW